MMIITLLWCWWCRNLMWYGMVLRHAFYETRSGRWWWLIILNVEFIYAYRGWKFLSLVPWSFSLSSASLSSQFSLNAWISLFSFLVICWWYHVLQDNMTLFGWLWLGQRWQEDAVGQQRTDISAWMTFSFFWWTLYLSEVERAHSHASRENLSKIFRINCPNFRYAHPISTCPVLITNTLLKHFPEVLWRSLKGGMFLEKMRYSIFAYVMLPSGISMLY